MDSNNKLTISKLILPRSIKNILNLNINEKGEMNPTNTPMSVTTYMASSYVDLSFITKDKENYKIGMQVPDRLISEEFSHQLNKVKSEYLEYVYKTLENICNEYQPEEVSNRQENTYTAIHDTEGHADVEIIITQLYTAVQIRVDSVNRGFIYNKSNGTLIYLISELTPIETLIRSRYIEDLCFEYDKNNNITTETLNKYQDLVLKRKIELKDKRKYHSVLIMDATYKLTKLINELFPQDYIGLTIDTREDEYSTGVLPSMYIGNIIAFYIASIIKAQDDEIQFEEAVDSLIDKSKPSTREHVTVYSKDYEFVIDVLNNYRTIYENTCTTRMYLLHYKKVHHECTLTFILEINHNTEKKILDIKLRYTAEASPKEITIGKSIEEALFKDRKNRTDYYLNKLLQEKVKTDQLQSSKASWSKK